MIKDIKQYALLGILVLASAFVNAQEYAVSTIADSLKENAVSVIRNYSAVYSQKDINNATFTVNQVITVLNDKGTHFGHFSSHGDKFTELKSFSGTLRNGVGKEIKKIKKGDLIESSYSTGSMATDSYSISYELKSPVYPYTVEYTYEMRMKNGIISYPHYAIVDGTGQSVEKSEYSLEIPLGVGLRHRASYDCKIEEDETANQKIYHISSGPMKAIKYEAWSPTFREYAPVVFFAPNDFCYDGVCGNFSTWDAYGKWVNILLANRDNLPSFAVEKAKDLTKDATTDREKVAILYKFMQDNSRYVSIQLGIGGFQPFPAESVYKSNYGDCKGLSNLMKALLKAVDIPSNYCEIYSGATKSLHKDFSNITQTNHAILLVPLQNDSIWLECTSQTLPFGYVHDDIAGHDALVITENGGVICQLPDYDSKDNLTSSKLVMNITEDGKIEGMAEFAEHGLKYGDYYYTMRSNDRERHLSYITGSLNFPRVSVSEIKTSEDLAEEPICGISAKYVAEDAVSKTGERLFIPIAPLKKSNLNVFNSTTREHDIVVNNGFSETDSLIINLPESYKIESLPKPVLQITPFGTFVAIAELQADGSILYIQQLDLFEGRYDKSKYAELRKFFQQISSATKRKIVAKKIEV